MKNVIKVSTVAALFAFTTAVFAQDAKPAMDGVKTEKVEQHKKAKKSHDGKQKSHHDKKAAQKAPNKEKGM